MKLLAALGLVAMMAGPVRADPALFVARGANAKVYILGSIHLLTPGTKWQTPLLRRILGGEVRQCWFEATELRVTPTTLVQLSQFFSPFQPLRTLLSPPNHDRLVARIEADYPGFSGFVEYMAPWVASLFVAGNSGMDVLKGTEPGVEEPLIAECRGPDRRMGSLESLTDVLALLNEVPLQEQVRTLVQTLDRDPVQEGTPFKEFESAWLRGDMERIGTIVAAFEASMPGFAGPLVRGRNARWLPKIEALLREDEAVLLTVGAGHLVGPGNLLGLLESRGYGVERLQ